MKVYDIGVIGAGVAGVFAALRLAENHKNKSVILFELGRGPAKRRRFLEGFLGCLPTGDGKLYPSDANAIATIADGRRLKSAQRYFFDQLKEVDKLKLIKNKQPNSALIKKSKAAGFDLEVRDYYQLYPESIHSLSKIITDKIESAGNITFNFDNEVFNLSVKNKHFVISTAEGDVHCKRVILCAGRTGWRWVNKLYRDLNILVSDEYATFGIQAEISAQYMKDFNKSHCLIKRNDLIVGPFSWGGSMIQEDHADLTIASFRSNENRWKTDKVFFNIIGKIPFHNSGCKQTDRLAKLAFLLFGDRVGREKIKVLLKGSSQLNLIPEYSWLPNIINELNSVIPSLTSRGYYHCPAIETTMSKIKLSSNLESEIDGLYIAGESAGISGIVAAGIMGVIAAESASK